MIVTADKQIYKQPLSPNLSAMVRHINNYKFVAGKFLSNTITTI